MNAVFVSRVAPALLVAALAGSTFAQVGGTPIAVAGLGSSNPLGTGTANGTAGLAFTANAFAGGLTSRTAVISQNGTVVFNAAFAGGQGIWRNSGSGNVNLARAGNALPSPASSGTFSTSLNFATPLVDASGNAMFWHAIAGTTGPLGATTDSGIFRWSTAGVGNFATRGSNAAGIGSGRPLPTDYSATPVTELQGNTNQSQMYLNNAGQSLLVGSWNNGSTSGGGGWTGAASAGNYDTLTPFFLRGDSFSGHGFTGILGDFIGGTLSFNDNGRAAFNVDFQSATGGTTSAQNRGLVTNRNGTNELLFVRSAAASFLPSGVTVGGIGSISPSMNNSGQIAQTIPVAGTGITQANDSMITRFDNGPSAGVFTLQEGTLSGRTTGGGAGIRFGGQLNSVSGFGISTIASDGTILSTSTGNTDTLGNVLAAGAGNAAIFTVSGSTNAINVIALTGDTAPSTGGGAFASFNAASRAINNNNLVAFVAQLTAGVGGVTTANDAVLYGTDLSGNLILIAREGFALPNDPVSGRTVSAINFGASINNNPTNGHDGRGIYLNDMNQLVFNVTFSDGNSGIFVTSIPTPATGAMLGLGMLASTRRRRS